MKIDRWGINSARDWLITELGDDAMANSSIQLWLIEERVPIHYRLTDYIRICIHRRNSMGMTFLELIQISHSENWKSHGSKGYIQKCQIFLDSRKEHPVALNWTDFDELYGFLKLWFFFSEILVYWHHGNFLSFLDSGQFSDIFYRNEKSRIFQKYLTFRQIRCPLKNVRKLTRIKNGSKNDRKFSWRQYTKVSDKKSHGIVPTDA